MDPRRKFWIASLFVWTLAVTVLRGIGTPNEFAAAHWLVDYRFGFVKRGFIGALVSLVTAPLSIAVTPQLIAAVAAVVFALFCVVVLALAFRIVARAGGDRLAVLLVLVFLSSPFIVMSAHLQGYFDPIVVILGALSVGLLLRDRPWLAGIVQGLAVLVHENAMVLVFPAFCLAWLLSNGKRLRAGNVGLPFMPLCVPLGTVLAVALSQLLTLDADFVPRMTQHLARYPFLGPERYADVPRWLATPFGDFFRQEGPKFLARITSVEMLSLILPSLLALFVGTVVMFRIVAVSLESALLLAICIVPLVTHAIAWDTARIWTYVLLCAFLAYWVYAECVATNAMDAANAANATDAAVDGGGSAAVTLLCLIALLFNVVLVTPLMDGRSEHFGIKTRLALYAPMFAGALVLLLQGRAPDLAARMRIQGNAVLTLLRRR